MLARQDDAVLERRSRLPSLVAAVRAVHAAEDVVAENPSLLLEGMPGEEAEARMNKLYAARDTLRAALAACEGGG